MASQFERFPSFESVFAVAYRSPFEFKGFRRGSGGQQISDLITLECPYSSRLVWEMVGSARSCVSVY